MSYDQPRIRSLDMTAREIVMALAEGNIGAVSVMSMMLKDGARIDPDSFLGSMTGLFSLDALDVYGSRIWMFYKDLCGEDIHTMLAVMRAHQLGYVSSHIINRAIDGERDRLDIGALLARVKESLPAFRLEAEPATDKLTAPSFQISR